MSAKYRWPTLAFSRCPLMIGLLFFILGGVTGVGGVAGRVREVARAWLLKTWMLIGSDKLNINSPARSNVWSFVNDLGNENVKDSVFRV